MNDRPNVPEQIGWGKQYSWRASFKAGAGWMFLAFLTDLPGIYLIQQHHDWPLSLRVLIALVPVAASLFYVRSIACWVRSMDELHRRLSLDAFLFATVAYLLLVAGWFLMDNAGVWRAVVQITSLHLERIPFSNCTFIICATYVLFGIGYSIFKRRYQ